jgi:hypothetical protein
MRQKQTLPFSMVLYCYNYGRLILDEVMNMSVNSGHYYYTTIVLTFPDVGLDLYLYLVEFVQI